MADPSDTVRNYSISAGGGMALPEVESSTTAINALTTATKAMEKALQDFSASSSTMAQAINRNLKAIGDTAATVAGQLGAVAAVAGGVSGSGGGKAVAAPSAPSTISSGTGGGWATSAVSSAGSAINRVLTAGSGSKLSGGLSLGTFLGTSEDVTKDILLAPLRYLRDRVTTNRNTAITASGALSMVGMQQGSIGSNEFNGASTARIMRLMSRFPGGVQGNPQDLIEMMAMAPSLGASYGFGGTIGEANTRGQGVRARGFFEGVREMQAMNPIAPIGGEGGIAAQLGGYAGNTQAQQRSMMFTGGAMGMIAAGGRQKSLSEWAESILRWFEGLRPGDKRGKGFDYGELMAQYFPGSNIDAWFNVNGVPQNMRDYWWTYALGKTTKVADTTAAGFTIGAEESNVAWNRLRASSELTRTEFSLAGQMAGQYANREQSNRWFNELLGSVQQQVIPMLSKGPFAWLQMLPDSIEDLLMTGAERGLSELLGAGDVPDEGAGDIGDIGYGALGGTGLSGLHPDMRSKVAKMMRANPRVKITSGLRDTGLQKRLKDKGYSKVSGKPSAHTRGMAADLGPPSQYRWIASNAGKFGLSSGKSHGEPWHVGMGDIGDPIQDMIEDKTGLDLSNGNAFNDFLGFVKDIGSSAGDMAGFVTKLLGRLVGGLGRMFGGADADTPSFAKGFDKGFYRELMHGSRSVQLGIPVGGGGGGNDDEGSSTFPPPGGRSVSPRDIYDYMKGGGVSQESAAGILANIRYESNFDPYNSSGDGGTSGGLFQHHAGRWAALKDYASSTGREWTNWRAEVDFALKEAGGYGINLQATNAAAAAREWTFKFERPANAEVRAEERAAIVDQYMFGDVPDHGDPYGSSMPVRSRTQHVVFNNTITINAAAMSGGGGGIDARRTAQVLADHLEAEMKTRLARAS